MSFAVATVMFVTTTLIALQCHYVKHLPWVASLVFLLFFGFFDGKLHSDPILMDDINWDRSVLWRCLEESTRWRLGAPHDRWDSVGECLIMYWICLHRS